MAVNLPLAFGELLAGGVLLTAGISGQSVADVFEGKVSLKGLDTTGAAAASSAPPSGGPANDAQARQWVVQGLELAGVPATPGNVATVLGRAKQESGFDPHAINLNDINAQQGHPSKGFLQTIDSTFSKFAVPGHTNIWDPVDNTAAAVRYMLATYGRLIGPGPGGY